MSDHRISAVQDSAPAAADTVEHTYSPPAKTLFPSWRGDLPYRERIETVWRGLLAAHPGLENALAELPFARFEAAQRPRTAVHKYTLVPDEAVALQAGIDEALRAPWLCALLLWHMRRFDGVFAKTALPPEFALHYADAFHRILDQIETSPGFAVLESDSFLKDLWLVRAVMIPAFAQVWWPRSGLSAISLLRAGPSASAYVFLRCGGRRPFFEGHTHDAVAKAYWNEPGWREALRLAALALPAMPDVHGAFGAAWFYDPEIERISPRISFAQHLQVGRGAHRAKIGSNDEAIKNATATSSERRRRYQEGTYLPTDYAIIWSRQDIAAAYGERASTPAP